LSWRTWAETLRFGAEEQAGFPVTLGGCIRSYEIAAR